MVQKQIVFDRSLKAAQESSASESFAIFLVSGVQTHQGNWHHTLAQLTDGLG